MKEEMLHRVWASQKFCKRGLRTTDGDCLTIFDCGEANRGCGPDFLGAKIKLKDKVYYGHVELHMKSSEWYAHKHEQDMHYDNVILHVVREDNRRVQRSDGTFVPTLVLGDRVSEATFSKVKALPSVLPCSGVYGTLPEQLLEEMMVAAMEVRLKGKYDFVKGLL